MTTLKRQLELNSEEQYKKTNLSENDMLNLLSERSVIVEILKTKSEKELLRIDQVNDKRKEVQMLMVINMRELMSHGIEEMPVADLPKELVLLREQDEALRNELIKLTSEEYVQEFEDVVRQISQLTKQ